MKIQKRRVNTKRHVIGYKIGGKWRSRYESVKLAKAGKLDGVSTYRREGGHYIQSCPTADFTLSELPTEVMA